MVLKENEFDWSPTTAGDKEAVWRQVDRLLKDASFNRSKRYPSLLRYIVSRTLDGDTGSLKERIIGMEVFGRDSDYDSTHDPIVRVTAAELRKRIARYYQNPAHEDELALDLLPGAYVARFRVPGDNLAPLPSTADGSLHSSPSDKLTRSALSTKVNLHSKWRWLMLSLCVLVIVVAGLLLRRAHPKDALEAFWQPLLESKQPILICTSDQQQLQDANQPVQPVLTGQATSFMSAETLAPVVELSSFLSSRGHLNHGQTEVRTTLSDLGSGPFVLVGAFNNFWTLKFTHALRFHFNNGPTHEHMWIQDDQDKSNRRWSIDEAHPDSFVDYALVVRYREPSTRQWSVIVGGLAIKGNLSALRFLQSRDLMTSFGNAAPRGWENKNLEIVLKTEVINGNSGPAQIEAIHTW